jgi:hypothetical protein
MNKKEGLKDFLEQAYGKEITDAELKEYKERFTKFVEILVEIDKKGKD